MKTKFRWSDITIFNFGVKSLMYSIVWFLLDLEAVELRQCVGLVELSLEHNKLIRPLLDFRSFHQHFNIIKLAYTFFPLSITAMSVKYVISLGLMVPSSSMTGLWLSSGYLGYLETLLNFFLKSCLCTNFIIYLSQISGLWRMTT